MAQRVNQGVKFPRLVLRVLIGVVVAIRSVAGLHALKSGAATSSVEQKTAASCSDRHNVTQSHVLAESQSPESGGRVQVGRKRALTQQFTQH